MPGINANLVFSGVDGKVASSGGGIYSAPADATYLAQPIPTLGIPKAAEYDQKGGYHIYGNGGNPKLPTAKYIYGSIDMSTRGHKLVEMASYTWELIWGVSDKSLIKYNNQLLQSHEIGDTIDNYVYWHHCRQCGSPFFQTVIKTDSTTVNSIP